MTDKEFEKYVDLIASMSFDYLQHKLTQETYLANLEMIVKKMTSIWSLSTGSKSYPCPDCKPDHIPDIEQKVEPAKKPTQIEINDLVFDIEETICEHVTEPAGQRCGYGITYDGEVKITELIKKFLGSKLPKCPECGSMDVNVRCDNVNFGHFDIYAPVWGCKCGFNWTDSLAAEIYQKNYDLIMNEIL